MRINPRLFRVLTVPLIVALLLASAVPVARAALDRPSRLKIMSGVVQVWWIWEAPDGLRGLGMGSGTIVSPDGLILTNHHVAFPDVDFVKHLGIALTARSDQPPQPVFLASVVADDPYLDLTVLRITHDIDLRPVRPGELNLPFVPLGNSDNLDVGDELNIFGYPGIGGDTVTFTRGVVSGFTLDAAIRGRAWVKTDTTIAGGNSGGTAVDENGLLVGVPTQAGSGDSDAMVDCRAVTDTNRDGKLDDKDTCVPIGGFLNALRPAELAKPLIEAARQGLAYQGRGDQQAATTAAGRPRLSNLQFAAGVTDSDQPSRLVTTLPSGSRSLYIFFDYENMTDGAPWELRVQFNGQDDPDTGLPQRPWVGGPAGNWWVGWSDADFRDGQYRFELVVDGQTLAEAQLQVGGQAQRVPTFSNIVFSRDWAMDGGPVDPSRLFPEDVDRLYWLFDYENMARGTEWTYTWLFNGEVVETVTQAWDEGSSGFMRNVLTSNEGLGAGNWRLELAIQGQLAAWADFTVTGGQGSAALFQPFVFASDVNQQTGKPNQVGTSFPTGILALYVFSDYRGTQDGMPMVSRVYLNEQLVIETPFKWLGADYDGPSGTWWNAIHANGDPLPDGEYTQELEVAGQVVQRGSALVGSGVQPTPTPEPAPPADGVQVQGVIVDADTGQPIPGAFFIVLMPGIVVDAFQWTDDEVYILAEADRRGAYVLSAPLAGGQCYSIIVGAEGYWPYTEDDVCIGPNTPNPAELTLQLQRR